MSDEIPSKIGKYDVLDVAGQGSMGVVYVGHDPFTDTKVAIKMCTLEARAESKQGRLARKMFFNEASAAGALHHPNILHVLDAGEEAGHPYIVMEFVDDATTLVPHIDASRLLPVRRVVEILYQCAKALDYAHRRGVIHRDIKPSNIMLTTSGDVKIGDFGVAFNALSDSTQVMGLLGSPRYMSPEQALEEETTNKSDLYALGVVGYELLTGHPPFLARGISQLVFKVVNEPPKPPREHRPEIPEHLEKVINRLMEKNPRRRYGSGQALAADLVQVFGELDATPRQPDDATKLSKLRGLAFFNEFGDDEIREVVGATRWESCRSGRHIIDEGKLEDCFYVLVNGDVSVRIGDREITTLHAGDCFGEMGYLSKSKRTASIVARDDVTYLRINAAMMDQTSIRCQLRFSQAFLKTLVARLARTSERLAESLES